MTYALPSIYTQKHIADHAKDLKQLERAQKGENRSFTESVRFRFNQIVDLFKTGKWAVEDQVRKQITRKFEKVNNLSEGWSEEMQIATKSRPEQIKLDLQMRMQLVDRLNDMKDTLRFAISLKKNELKLKKDDLKLEKDAVKLETLEQIISNVIVKNKFLIDEEDAFLKKDIQHQTLTQHVKIVKRAYDAKRKDKLYEKRAAELNKTIRFEPGRFEEDRISKIADRVEVIRNAEYSNSGKLRELASWRNKLTGLLSETNHKTIQYARIKKLLVKIGDLYESISEIEAQSKRPSREEMKGRERLERKLKDDEQKISLRKLESREIKLQNILDKKNEQIKHYDATMGLSDNLVDELAKELKVKPYVVENVEKNLKKVKKQILEIKQKM